MEQKIQRSRSGYLLLEVLLGIALSSVVFSAVYLFLIGTLYQAPASARSDSVNRYNYQRFIAVMHLLLPQSTVKALGSEHIDFTVYRLIDKKEDRESLFCYRFQPARNELRIGRSNYATDNCNGVVLYGLVSGVESFKITPDTVSDCIIFKAGLSGGYSSEDVICR